MIIFTGTGRSGTGMYAKMFNAHHEYEGKRFVDLLKEKIPNWHEPERDYLVDPQLRKEIITTHLQDVDLSTFRDSSNLYTYFLDIMYEMDTAIKIVLGLRDGRDFARSGISRGYHTERYHQFGMIPEKNSPFYSRWDSLDPIEKMAWLWTIRNQKAFACLQRVPQENYFIVRLEDLIAGDENEENTIHQLEDFLGLKMDRHWLTHKDNQNPSYAMESKEEWTPLMNDMFMNIAGPMMKKLGYS